MKYPNKYCISNGEDGGAFKIPFKGRELFVIASHGAEWDHVSVSLSNRTPNWQEMCFIKDLFFEKEECVIQYHPPKSKYVDIHSCCLHLWKPHNIEIPMPPLILV